jgi:hypothetical protein
MDNFQPSLSLQFIWLIVLMKLCAHNILLGDIANILQSIHKIHALGAKVHQKQLSLRFFIATSTYFFINNELGAQKRSNTKC